MSNVSPRKLLETLHSKCSVCGHERLQHDCVHAVHTECLAKDCECTHFRKVG
jgi:hypothetical protein